MNLHLIDWSIMVGLVVILTVGALSTRRYTNTATAFLAANRCGGRYLLSVASGMASIGVITLVWFFEINYDVGFTSIWWGYIGAPMGIIMALSGWVIYRFRQTRAMTLAQFFEMRYSKNFRVFSGLLSFLAGIINFGIFPSVGARFFMAICGLPEAFVLADFEIFTFPVIMFVLLAISLFFTFLGGQIAIMVTDFIQGTFCNILFAVLIIYLLFHFKWSQISETLLLAEPGKSSVNPFDLGKEENFNIWFYVIGAITFFYGALGWQGTAGYNCSAKSAHETKMSGILGKWRIEVLMLIVLVLPVCVRTFLNHKDFALRSAPVHRKIEAMTARELEKLAAENAAQAKELQSQARHNHHDSKSLLDQANTFAGKSRDYQKLARITPAQLAELKQKAQQETNKENASKKLYELYQDKTDEIQSQARVPLTMGLFLPKGLLGLFCAALLAAFISTHDTYLHSWGSMFVQDVVLPFRKKSFTPRQHLWMLRGAIFGVAVFIFIFSMFFNHVQRISMYCAIAASIFVGGAGTVIIGGLYWKRGTTPAAWTAMISGLVLSVLGIFITQAGSGYLQTASERPFWAVIDKFLDSIGLADVFWKFMDLIFSLNAQVLTFWIIVICVMLYVVVSLLTGRNTKFNMDRMLHRGKYALAGETSVSFKDAETIAQKLGFTKEFTRSDTIITIITLGWPLVLFVVFCVMNLYYAKFGISDQAWLKYWRVWMWIIFGGSVAVTIWFTIGGFKDVRYMYRTLRNAEENQLEDGRVEDHHNVGE